LRALLAAAGLLAFPLSACALFEDRVEVFAGENVTWDDNLFRLSQNLNPTSDRIATTSLGISANVPYSLQRFQLGYTWFTSRYQKNDYLNFDGHTGRATWLWAVTPRLTGDLGYAESTALASFANFVGSQSRDIIKTRQAFANAVWFSTPSWRWHGTLGESDQKHDDPAHKVYDVDTTNGEAGVTYVTGLDNRIGGAIRAERGRTPDVGTVTNIDNSYKQFGAGVLVHYVLTGHSMLDGRADYVKREYDQDTSRNYSGPTLRLTHTWSPTPKIEVVTTARREISPIEEIQSSNFVLVKGISLKPKWLATEKITLTGNVGYDVWDYRGDPIIGTSYTHHIRGYGLALAYRPTLKILLTAGWTHEKRTSTLVNADYDDDIFSVEGRVSF